MTALLLAAAALASPTLVAAPHGAPVELVAVSPDGAYVASYGGHRLKLWAVDGRLLADAVGPDDAVDLVVRDDGTAWLGAEHGLLYRAAPGTSEATIVDHIAGDVVIGTGIDHAWHAGTVSDLGTTRTVAEVEAPWDVVWFSADRAVQIDRNELVVWARGDGARAAVRLHGQPESSGCLDRACTAAVDVSDDGRRGAACVVDDNVVGKTPREEVLLLDLDRAKILARHRLPWLPADYVRRGCGGVHVDATGAWAAGRDGLVRVDGGARIVAPGAFTAVDAAAGVLATGDADGTVTLRDAGTGDLLRVLAAPAASPYALSFAPDGTLIAEAGQGQRDARTYTTVRWDLAAARRLPDGPEPRGGDREQLALRFDGDRVHLKRRADAPDWRDGWVNVPAAFDGERSYPLPDGPGVLADRPAAVGPERVAIGLADGRVALLDAASRILSLQAGEVRDLAFHPTLPHVYVLAGDGEIIAWDHAADREVARLRHLGATDFVVRLPDGSYTASLGALGALHRAEGDYRAFDAALNRPDRVMRALGTASPEAVAAAEQAVAHRQQADVAGEASRAGAAGGVGVVRVLAVGVSEYARDEYDLAYARKDAEEVAALFAELPWGVGRAEVRTLVDGDVTREGFAEAAAWLAEAGPEDVAVLFMAGHGVIADGSFWFGTADVDLAAPAARGLPREAIAAALAASPAQRKLALIDACHSGREDVADGTVAAVGARGVAVHATRAAVPPVEGDWRRIVEERFVPLGDTTGAHVIGASSGAAVALEGDRWGNGVFTYALKEALIDRAADLDHDGELRVSELHRYLGDRVVVLTDGLQRPTSTAFRAEADFVLARARAAEEVATQEGYDAGVLLTQALVPTASGVRLLVTEHPHADPDATWLAELSGTGEVRRWVRGRVGARYEPAGDGLIAWDAGGELWHLPATGRARRLWDDATVGAVAGDRVITAAWLSYLGDLVVRSVGLDGKGATSVTIPHPTPELLPPVAELRALAADHLRLVLHDGYGWDPAPVHVARADPMARTATVGAPLGDALPGSLVLSADGRVLAGAASEHAVQIWRVDDGAEVTVPVRDLLVASIGGGRGLALSADGALLAAIRRGEAPGVALIDTATGREVAWLDLPEGDQYPEAVAIAPSGDVFVASQQSGRLRLYRWR